MIVTSMLPIASGALYSDGQTGSTFERVMVASDTLSVNLFAMLKMVVVLFIASLVFRLVMAAINSGLFAGSGPASRAPEAPYVTASPVPQTWDATVAEHDRILADWRAHREEDLQLKLTHLLLQDLNDPAVAAAATALATAEHHRATRPASPGPDITATAYWRAVQDAGAKVDAAIAKAARVGTSALPPEEAERIAEAQAMLARALDAGNYPAERQLAYQRVVRLIAGIVDDPTPALASLAAKAGLKAITATAPHGAATDAGVGDLRDPQPVRRTPPGSQPAPTVAASCAPAAAPVTIPFLADDLL